MCVGTAAHTGHGKMSYCHVSFLQLYSHKTGSLTEHGTKLEDSVALQFLSHTVLEFQLNMYTLIFLIFWLICLLYVFVCPGTHVKFRRWLVGGSFLLPCWLWGLNSGSMGKAFTSMSDLAGPMSNFLMKILRMWSQISVLLKYWDVISDLCAFAVNVLGQVAMRGKLTPRQKR